MSWILGLLPWRKLVVPAITVVVVGLAGWGVVNHYRAYKAAISAQAAAEIRAESAESLVTALEEARAAQAAAVARVAEVRREAEEKVNELAEKFARHDIAAIAQAKPRSLERILNAASADTLRMLECNSGRECASQHTEDPATTESD